MKIPTLNAWVDTPDEQADYLLGCFYTSENLQSTLSYGNIQSLPYLIQRYGKEPLTLQTNATEQLEQLLSTVFEVNLLDLKVTADESEPNSLAIRLNCVVSIDGKEVSLGHLLRYVDGRLSNIQKKL
jgi:hypothetical protein